MNEYRFMLHCDCDESLALFNGSYMGPVKLCKGSWMYFKMMLWLAMLNGNVKMLKDCEGHTHTVYLPTILTWTDTCGHIQHIYTIHSILYLPGLHPRSRTNHTYLEQNKSYIHISYSPAYCRHLVPHIHMPYLPVHSHTHTFTPTLNLEKDW